MSTAPAPETASANAAGREYLRVVVIAALIGIPAALVAAAFLGAVHILQQWLWTELPAQLGYAQLPWFVIIGLPVVGALLVVVARRFLPGDGGAEPLGGLAAERPTPLSYAPGVALAAIGTLAFGAVLGNIVCEDSLTILTTSLSSFRLASLTTHAVASRLHLTSSFGTEACATTDIQRFIGQELVG